MSKKKKEIRRKFRDSVFKRDNFGCKVCKNKFKEDELDAYHITDRNDMPNGGYTKMNGITVCLPCHELVEVWHRSGHENYEEGLHPNDLYKMINSSYEKAYKASEKI